MVRWGLKEHNTDLLVVLFIPAAGFDEDETPSALSLFFAQAFALPVLDREVVGVAVHVFERGKDFAHVSFDDVEEGGDLVETREGQEDGVRCCGHHWGQNRYAGDDSEGAFGTDE